METRHYLRPAESATPLPALPESWRNKSMAGVPSSPGLGFNQVTLNSFLLKLGLKSFLASVSYTPSHTYILGTGQPQTPCTCLGLVHGAESLQGTHSFCLPRCFSNRDDVCPPPLTPRGCFAMSPMTKDHPAQRSVVLRLGKPDLSDVESCDSPPGHSSELQFHLHNWEPDTCIFPASPQEA